MVGRLHLLAVLKACPELPTRCQVVGGSGKARQSFSTGTAAWRRAGDRGLEVAHNIARNCPSASTSPTARYPIGRQAGRQAHRGIGERLGRSGSATCSKKIDLADRTVQALTPGNELPAPPPTCRRHGPPEAVGGCCGQLW